MTLHWWMHWFWVTVLLTLYGIAAPSLAAPQSEELQYSPEIQHRVSDRQSRAMYNLNTKTPKGYVQILYTKTPQATTQVPTEDQTDRQDETTTTNATIEIVHPSVQWAAADVTDAAPNKSASPQETSVNATIIDANLTETQNATFAARKRNLTRPDYLKEASASVAESHIVTDKPLSLETPILQTRIPPNLESYRSKVMDQGEAGMDTGAIAGISFAALVLAALAGSTAFVLYRRRYLNKPQTLNDKCSNPDSSGYLDDSTIRDNSEEMYSLDNDSFLNSLEAMTIQNYWTDTVKHTKL